MGHVNLKPARILNTDMARLFGAPVAARHALVVQQAAKRNADIAAKHSSVANRITIGVHAHGTHSMVVMSVTGRDGTPIASHLEFGYYNQWLENKLGPRSPGAWMPGLHIMGNARYA